MEIKKNKPTGTGLGLDMTEISEHVLDAYNVYSNFDFVNMQSKLGRMTNF